MKVQAKGIKQISTRIIVYKVVKGAMKNKKVG